MILSAQTHFLDYCHESKARKAGNQFHQISLIIYLKTADRL